MVNLSIFYEYYALDYLRRMGYDDKEIKYLESARVYDLWDGIMNTFLIGHYVKIFIENYDINQDLDVKYTRMLSSDMQKYLSLNKIQKKVLENCDDCTELIMSNPFF